MGAKSRLWRLLVRFCVCAVPLEGWVQNSEPTEVLPSPQGVAAMEPLNFVTTWQNWAQPQHCRDVPEKPLFTLFWCRGREVPPWQNWAVHLLYIPLALHGTDGWPGLQQTQSLCWSKYLGRVQPGPGKHMEILETGGQWLIKTERLGSR